MTDCLGLGTACASTWLAPGHPRLSHLLDCHFILLDRGWFWHAYGKGSWVSDHILDSIESCTIHNVKSKRSWWRVTTSLRPALILGGGYLVLGLGGLAGGLAGGKIWPAVLGGLYFLCGTPWYITAVVLLKQRHNAASNQH